MSNYRKYESQDCACEKMPMPVPNYCRHEVQENICPLNAMEEIDVTVPVTVRANCNVGKVCINCMGAPCVSENMQKPYSEHCPISNFVINQKLYVEIPLMYTAEVDVGQEHVCFGPPCLPTAPANLGLLEEKCKCPCDPCKY